jgi:hypothetical protein
MTILQRKLGNPTGLIDGKFNKQNSIGFMFFLFWVFSVGFR